MTHIDNLDELMHKTDTKCRWPVNVYGFRNTRAAHVVRVSQTRGHVRGLSWPGGKSITPKSGTKPNKQEGAHMHERFRQLAGKGHLIYKLPLFILYYMYSQ